MSAISQAHVLCAQVRRRQRIHELLKCGIADVPVGEVCRANGGPEGAKACVSGVYKGVTGDGLGVRGLGSRRRHRSLFTAVFLSESDRGVIVRRAAAGWGRHTRPIAAETTRARRANAGIFNHLERFSNPRTLCTK